MNWPVILIGAFVLSLTWSTSLGQRIPPLPPNFQNPNIQPVQNITPPGINLQNQNPQQQNEDSALNKVTDENVRRVLLELSTVQTTSQMTETMSRVGNLVGPLFIADFDQKKDAMPPGTVVVPQRILSAVTDLTTEVRSLVLQKKLEDLHSQDFSSLSLSILYGLQDAVLRNVSGMKLASVVRVNPGDTVIAFKMSQALVDRQDQQLEFLQSVGTKLLPDVQRILMRQLVQWWGDTHTWRDRELTLLTSAGSPLLCFIPQSELESLDDELADRFVTALGQAQDIAREWWKKPMSLKKSWFELAKGARYFGAVHEWSFRRMQKLSFLLEGASPEDLELIPPVPEIKGLVIANHYTELQSRVVFDAFYHSAPLSQEDLQEFQFHVLDLTPQQLQRFDFADSFATLDEMLSLLEMQPQIAYPTVLQISYYMWPIINMSTDAMSIFPPIAWQKRELSQIGRLFFILPKSVHHEINPDLFNWDSNLLPSIRSKHLSQFQIWKITSQILQTVDERFKPDYIFMIPQPFQQGIPTQNISQALLATTVVRPEVLRALLQETSGMLTSQKAIILQRISHRINEPIIIRSMISTANPSEMFSLISPKVLSKNMATITKTILEMPDTGKFGSKSMKVKLLPPVVLSIWLRWARETGQLQRWTPEDLLSRSLLGKQHELGFAILGLTCRDIELVDPWDIMAVIMHYRHELYALKRLESKLKFNVNLRSCVLSKFSQYLKQKKFLNQGHMEGVVLTEITGGEIEAIGGEILSVIPGSVLEKLAIEQRMSILQEIGKVQMLELFSLVPLENLHWSGRTLFRDIEVTVESIDRANRKRREDSSVGSQTSNATTPESVNEDVTAFPIPGIDSRSLENSAGEHTPTAHTPSPPKHINLESLNNMGNLLCYADNIFDVNWSKTLLRDVLEGKTAVGEKTCCLSRVLREKWFHMLQIAYGADTSTWNEFDLTSIGDLLIVLPEADLKKISKDSLGKAVTPIMRQSAYAIKVLIPGQPNEVQFVKACAEALGNEGMDFVAAYKTLMRKVFQTTQWLVSTVKTTREMVREARGRTGRLPRWAEHTLVKRQVPIQLGSDLSYSGSTSPSYYPSMANPSTSYYPVSSGGDSFGQTNPNMNSQTQSYGGYSTQYQTGTQAYYGTGTGATSNQGFGQTGVMSNQGGFGQTGTISNQGGFGQTGTMSNQGSFGQAGTGSNQGTFGQVGAGSNQGSFAQAGAGSNQGTFGQAGAGSNQGTFGQAGAGSNQGSFGQAAAGSNQGSFAQAGAASNQGSFGQAGAASNQGGFGQTGTISNQGSFAQSGAMSNQGSFGQTGALSNQASFGQAGVVSNQGSLGLAGAASTQGSFGQAGSASNQGSFGQAGAASNQGSFGQAGAASNQGSFGQTGAASNQGSFGQAGAASNQGSFGQTGAASNQGSFGQAGAASIQGGFGQTGAASNQGSFGQTGAASNQGSFGQTGAASNQGSFGQTGTTFNQGSFSPGQQPGVMATQQANFAPVLLGGTIIPSQQGSFIPNQQGGTVPSQQGSNIPIQDSGVLTNPTETGSSPDAQVGMERQRSVDASVFQDESHNEVITCHGIKAAGSAAIGLSIDDLNKLTQKDLSDCIEAFGKIDWDDEMKGSILSLLKQKVNFDEGKLNALTLIEMGDLVTSLNSKPTDANISDGFTSTENNSSTPVNSTLHSDLSRIDFTLPHSLDMLSILGQKVVDPPLLESVAEIFNQDNKIFPGFPKGFARPENLRIVVMSLGNILCGFNEKIVNSIFESDSALFIDTSSVLGKLQGCSFEVLSTLASQAVKPSSYGGTSLWSQEDVEAIGVVLAGLKAENIPSIPPDAMQGVTPLAVKNLPIHSLGLYSAEQLSRLSFSAAMALTPSQLHALTPEQAVGIRNILKVRLEIFNLASDEEEHLDVNLRDTPHEGNETDIAGRSRESTITVPDDGLENVDSTSNTPETTTTPPPVVTPPAKPSSSVKLFAFSIVTIYCSIMSAIIPVIQLLKV